jgi:hypothetical protein
MAVPRQPRARGRAPLIAMLALMALALAGVAVLLGYSAYTARGGTPAGAATATANAATLTAQRPTATPTATAAPSPSPTTHATATPNPTAKLDAEAAASFRAVYLGAFADQSCSPGNARKQFAQGQTIYANLCTSDVVVTSPMTVSIVQNGASIFTMSSQTYLSTNASYFAYSNYGLAPGAYEVQVSIAFPGHVAIAKVLPFTVG